MPRIYVRATGSPKFIRVTDLLTPEAFGPKRQTPSDANWTIDIGGFDHNPAVGSIMIEVAAEERGTYSVHEGNKLVHDKEVCAVDDSNLPKQAAKKRARTAA
jgi:hypothetical protein